MKAQKLRGREKILSARIASILVFATLLLSVPLAQAVPITIEITGNITSVGGDVGSIPSTIYAGVSFTGTYTYDSLTLDSDPDPHRGIYVHDAPYGLSIILGGYEFKTAPNHTGNFEMQISDDSSVNGVWDYYAVGSDQIISVPSSGFTTNYISWGLGDSTHTALSSDALPVIAPVLTNWDRNVLTISGSGEHGLSIKGTVTQAVPEPLTGVLMLIGLLFFRRRR